MFVQPDGRYADVVFADAQGVKTASLCVWLGDHRVLEVHEPQGGGYRRTARCRYGCLVAGR
jgi:hypothetical protein